MNYLQEYLKQFGVRKCEANALVIIPELSRKLVTNSITEFLGEDALIRFDKKREEILNELSEFRKKTGLQESLETALNLIDKTDN